MLDIALAIGNCLAFYVLVAALLHAKVSHPPVPAKGFNVYPRVNKHKEA